MPVTYERDDERRLIIVTVTEPHSSDDAVREIEQFASDDTRDYAILYDERGLTEASTQVDLLQMASRIRGPGRSRRSAPIGIAIRPDLAVFRVALTHPRWNTAFVNVEVLFTSAQMDSWLSRHTRRSSPRTPSPTPPR